VATELYGSAYGTSLYAMACDAENRPDNLRFSYGYYLLRLRRIGPIFSVKDAENANLYP
jgi:hypothetical protein